MGEYFPDAKPKEEETKEELITNFNSLFAAYDILVNKIQTITNEGYETILPIRTELMGSKKTPDDIGQVGKLRRKIENSRIYRMELGMDMYSALKNIEDLSSWSERYITYIEDNMDGLKLICKSAFKMIVDLHKQIDESQARIRKIEDQMVIQTAPIPQKIVPPKAARPKDKPQNEIKDYEKKIEQKELEDTMEYPETEPQVKLEEGKKHKITAVERRRQEKIDAPVDDVFKKMLNEKLANYIEAEKIGDMNKIKLAKMQVFGICGYSTHKKKFVEEEFNKIALKKV